MTKNYKQNKITSNGMRKYTSYILILIVLVGLFSPAVNVNIVQAVECTSYPDGVFTPAGCTEPLGICYDPYNRPTDLTHRQCLINTGGFQWKNPGEAPPGVPINVPVAPLTSPLTPIIVPTDLNYHLLAPLPCTDTGPNCKDGKLMTFNPTVEKPLGAYLNLMIKLVIGLSAVMAVVMIVIGGIEYMTSELPGNKESGRERIRNAILGLLIALGAYALLNTINPELLNSDVKIDQATIVVTLDQANFAKTEKTATSVGTKYTLSGTTSFGVSDFIKNNGTSLNNITVDTVAKKASFCAGINCVSVPINIGLSGVASAGQAQSGDSKTPIGTTTIGGDIRIGSNGNAVISGNGYNLGAAFVNIGVKDSAGNDRGIGFHGSYNDNLGTTNGCIRMSNEDLIALAPYMKPGVKVTIK
ncbi:hypothetical protein A3B85_02260 [Candidatus Nomurabacteria bacterium RIFCSPHIGHO2_02_FULL_37_13]|uniref:L,D-TPase catalytic domain-containing protein n=1 Tax=Candidatus Nomurabacteria bacterium RIFCSPHIGHO2_02_FULL_37_13 TaxID=1801750 RepID=A0A1F6W648_9BACT|nr:MAG: hypothetical protein A2640_02070 [Candidatus Nomurabacteria bacterium RIFCSPHIGHO2_01_FULL_36_23]OGI77371.1 MAG: hypothetical protein A3B85_02260 [Candidatus Nomurabacteria bacterium RIFCSPHIGHO2_02_FULL_37_13]